MNRLVTITLFVAVATWGFYLPAAGQLAADYNAVGFQHYNAKNWGEAIVAFEKAYDLAPDNATIRRNLANAYQAEANELAKAGAMAAAIETASTAVEIDPGNAQALVQLGSYYLREGLVNEAIFRLEEAIELEPRNVDAHFLLGEAYYKDNDATSALDQWEWVRQVDPGREGLVERMDKAYRQEKVEYNFEDLSSRNFRITYNRAVRWGNAKSVLNVLEQAYRDIGRQLGGVYPPTPIQVTLYSAEGFSETTQMGEHVGASYDGSKIRVPVLDKNGDTIGLEELRRRLIHEYVHVVVRHLAKEHAPWWLNEGLAEALSKDISQTDRAYLQRAKRDGLLFSLDELSVSQLNELEVESLQLGYRQSHAAVTVLVNRYGARRLGDMLRSIGQGVAPEAALTRSCHYNYNTLERATQVFIDQG